MIIIKIGGGASLNHEAIIKDISELDEKIIIIHGANAFRDKLANDLKLEKKVLTSVKGYSSVYSDETAIDLMMMTYSGLQNKKIVQLCQQYGLNAVGLTGLDGKSIVGKRNNGIRVRENGKLKIVRDNSGKPKSVNKELIELLLHNGYVPVFTLPIIDEQHIAINSENDDVVALFQETFHAEKIISLIEAPGYLEDKDNPETVVHTMSKHDLDRYEAQVEGRMKRKILALKKFFHAGEVKVYLSDGRTNSPIKDALEGKGTIIS